MASSSIRDLIHREEVQLTGVGEQEEQDAPPLVLANASVSDKSLNVQGLSSRNDLESSHVEISGVDCLHQDNSIRSILNGPLQEISISNGNTTPVEKSRRSPTPRNSSIIRRTVSLSNTSRPLKRRAMGFKTKAIPNSTCTVQHFEEEEEEDANDEVISGNRKRNFDVISDELLAEARHYASELSEKPGKAIDLLVKLQSIVANLQEALGSHTRVHVVLEAEMPGNTSKTKFRHVVPIFSRTLIPSFCVDVQGSAIVATSLIEVLAIAEKVANSDRNSEVPVLDYSVSDAIELKLPDWYPGEAQDILSSECETFASLSSYCKYDASAEAKQAAAAELRSIYQSYITRQSTEDSVDIDLISVIPDVPPKADGARILYCNPIIFEMLSKIDVKSFSVAWREFFLHLHNIHNDRSKAGPLVYKKFTPPWLHGRVHFLVGRKSVEVIRVSGAKLPSKKEVQTDAASRQLARCILSVWLILEPDSREFLIRTLSKYDCVIGIDELSFSNCTSVQLPPKSYCDLSAESETWQEEDCQAKHNKYFLNSVEINTLRPFCVPCNSVVDAFFSLLRINSNESVLVTHTDFMLTLVKYSTESLLRWEHDHNTRSVELASHILMPLNDDATHHWGVAVLTKGKRIIEIYDSMPRRHVFAPIYPRLLRWSRSFLRSHTSHGWSTDLKISERTDVGDGHELAVDSAIFACVYAAQAIKLAQFENVHCADVTRIRKFIRDCVVRGVIPQVLHHNNNSNNSP